MLTQGVECAGRWIMRNNDVESTPWHTMEEGKSHKWEARIHGLELIYLLSESF